jgi:long-chain acyl-CoA synthetase
MNGRPDFNLPTGSPRNVLKYWSTKNGGLVAVRLENYQLSYAELAEMAGEVAGQLGARDIGEGDQVALVIENSVDFIIGLFAIFHLGATAVTMDPELKREQLSQLLESGEVDYLLVKHRGELNTQEWNRSIVSSQTVSFNLLQRQQPIHKTVQLTSKILLHRCTSGSTGIPRHVLSTEAQIADDYLHLLRGLGLSTRERFLGIAPFFHAFGCLALLSALASGSEIYPVSKFHPGRLVNNPVFRRSSVFFATPPMIELLGRCFIDERKAGAFAEMKHCICATARLKIDSYEKFKNRFGIGVRILYGSSETLSATITDGNVYAEGCVGEPLPGVSLAIFDAAGEMLPVGQVGRVGVKSPSSCDGYSYGVDSLSICAKYVLPGDKGYVDERGKLYILGRDDLINIGGYKVDRIEIESLISDRFPVCFILIQQYDRMGQPALEAVIEGDEGALDPGEITDFCKAKLLPYKIPSRIRIFSALPRDANGKVRISDIPKI